MEADYSVTDGGASDLPDKVVEEAPAAAQTKSRPTGNGRMPLMDALQDAMQEINIFPPSASTVALSSMAAQDPPPIGLSDPLNSAGRPLAIVIGQEEEEDAMMDLGHPAHHSIEPDGGLGGELHGGCLTTDDVDRIQTLVNEFCLKALLPHFERQMRLLNEAVSTRKSARQSILSATKRWFGSTQQ